MGGFVVVAAGLAAALLAAPVRAAEVDPDLEAAGEDAVLASVGEEPILASEIDRFLALEGVALEPIRSLAPLVAASPEAGAGDAEVEAEEAAEQALRRRVLELVIDERLRSREIDRFGFTELPQQEIEAEIQAFRSRFASRERFEARLAELGLDPAALRRRVAHRLLARLFAEERLSPRRRLENPEMRAYYDDVLAPELRARGERVPPFEAAGALIGRRLEAQLVGREIERWTEELRREAAIEYYLEPSAAAP